MKKTISFRFFIATAALVISGCAVHAAPEANDDQLRTEILATDDQIANIIEKGSCKVDADCAVLPMGNKPCGGPSSYTAYSKKLAKEDIETLFQLSARSAELAKTLNIRNQRLSNCQYEPEPAVKCVESKCVTQAAKGRSVQTY